MIVIGLSGWAGSGKNTVGSLAALRLSAKHDLRVQMASFAAPLKELAVSLGWDGQKNDAGRFLLQRIGESYRQKNPNHWIDNLWIDIESVQNQMRLDQENCEIYAGRVPNTHMYRDVYVVTDVRYRNEAEWLTSKLRAEGHQTALWRVSMWGRVCLTGGAGKHASETELDDWSFDARIEADKGDMLKLYESTNHEVDRLIASLEGKCVT